jgi:hypothetical protein
MSKGFTRVKDVDYQILGYMNSQDLVNACQTDKTIYKYCNDTNLWENKLLEEQYYFITDYPDSTVGWISLFKRLNIARANLNRMLLICKILPSRYIYIQGPEKRIRDIIYAYFHDEAKQYINSIDDLIIIKDNIGIFGSKQIIMSKEDINYLLLIAYYYETFNDYVALKDAEEYLLITDKEGVPFLINNTTRYYITGDSYYDSKYAKRVTIGETIDYMQKHFHCVQK